MTASPTGGRGFSPIVRPPAPTSRVRRRHHRSVEMRHSVTTPSYRFRKALDNALYSLNWRHVAAPAVAAALAAPGAAGPFPGTAGGWLPLYTMVTFRADVSYSTARRKHERQSRVLGLAAWLSAGAGVVAAGVAAAAFLRRAYGRP